LTRALLLPPAEVLRRALPALSRLLCAWQAFAPPARGVRASVRLVVTRLQMTRSVRAAAPAC
jgi:hypothetical protein